MARERQRLMHFFQLSRERPQIDVADPAIAEKAICPHFRFAEYEPRPNKVAD